MNRLLRLVVIFFIYNIEVRNSWLDVLAWLSLLNNVIQCCSVNHRLFVLRLFCVFHRRLNWRLLLSNLRLLSLLCFELSILIVAWLIIVRFHNAWLRLHKRFLRRCRLMNSLLDNLLLSNSRLRNHFLRNRLRCFRLSRNRSNSRLLCFLNLRRFISPIIGLLRCGF